MDGSLATDASVSTADEGDPRDANAQDLNGGPQPSAQDFVHRRGTALCLRGERVRLVGSHAFYLQEESARAALGWTDSLDSVSQTFAIARRNGVRVLRIAAFNELAGDPAVIQSAPGVLSEPGLLALDRVVARAATEGVMLVMVLSNYWDDYGGLPAYLRWFSLATDYDHRALSMMDPRVQRALKQYMQAIVQRVNTVTGRRYAHEPAVLAWELINEPRGTNLHDGGVQFAAMIHSLAQSVRDAGARQLVIAGDEGYDSDSTGYDTAYWHAMDDRLIHQDRGESFRRVVFDPLIDVATVHWYPDHWRVPPSMAREGGVRWLREHVAIALQANKPVLFEEFGLMVANHRSLSARRQSYNVWFSAAFAEESVVGVMPWGMHFRPSFRERNGMQWGPLSDADDPYALIVRSWSERFANSARRDASVCAERSNATDPASPRLAQ
jgi:mannan endo-1,4-beta-mannosidase